MSYMEDLISAAEITSTEEYYPALFNELGFDKVGLYIGRFIYTEFTPDGRPHQPTRIDKACRSMRGVNIGVCHCGCRIPLNEFTVGVIIEVNLQERIAFNVLENMFLTFLKRSSEELTEEKSKTKSKAKAKRHRILCHGFRIANGSEDNLVIPKKGGAFQRYFMIG